MTRTTPFDGFLRQLTGMSPEARRTMLEGLSQSSDPLGPAVAHQAVKALRKLNVEVPKDLFDLAAEANKRSGVKIDPDDVRWTPLQDLYGFLDEDPLTHRASLPRIREDLETELASGRFQPVRPFPSGDSSIERILAARKEPVHGGYFWFVQGTALLGIVQKEVLARVFAQPLPDWSQEPPRVSPSVAGRLAFMNRDPFGARLPDDLFAPPADPRGDWVEVDRAQLNPVLVARWHLERLYLQALDSIYAEVDALTPNLSERSLSALLARTDVSPTLKACALLRAGRYQGTEVRGESRLEEIPGGLHASLKFADRVTNHRLLGEPTGSVKASALLDYIRNSAHMANGAASQPLEYFSRHYFNPPLEGVEVRRHASNDPLELFKAGVVAENRDGDGLRGPPKPKDGDWLALREYRNHGGDAPQPNIGCAVRPEVSSLMRYTAEVLVRAMVAFPRNYALLPD